MDLIWEKFTEWLKELLVGGIMDNLTGLFDNVNAKVAEAAGHIGSTPQAWNANIYSMIRSLSDNVILPIAGVILAFVMTLELIQLIADRNNLHDIDTWVFFRWVFKTAAAVLIVSNTWNIIMGVFEAAQSVVNRASGLMRKPQLRWSAAAPSSPPRAEPSLIPAGSSISRRKSRTPRCRSCRRGRYWIAPEPP